ncbi:GNAT family N-acetyltransferase [Propylenella binzhouense]|uniref:N-acetyltransferase n=1 Tax=Propylenella binzhouense TaxID=2555902 RepID=A0A964T5T6_9HYPH|nr:GNAT family protein [Propylenella binzhouense]MYZ49003.1 N-acetyltransferase [Propylenella binzhouense]
MTKTDDLSGWSPRALPDASPMAGALVELVPLDPEAHWRPLWRAFGGAESRAVWTFMPIGPFEGEAAFREGLRWIAARPDWVPFAILDRAGGGAFGTASYMRIDPANGSAEVGCIVFGEGLRRRPGATEAMLLMAKRVFDELGYRRYEWKCDALNAPSRAAAERFGFTYEGTFRQHMVTKGRNRDTAWFAMTDGDWPAVRAGMEAWLAETSFDREGAQRTRLADAIASARAGAREPA